MASKQEEYLGKVIIGIDLGTTKSGVAVWRPDSGKVEMVVNADGDTIMPSMVGWDQANNRWLVGAAAKRFAIRHLTAVARSLKRIIGRPFTDTAVQSAKTTFPFKVEIGDGEDRLQDVIIKLGIDRAGSPVRLSAPQVSAKILARLREEAATFLNLPRAEVRHAVITVPAYFNHLQRKATILAGNQAGLNVVDILNEPTAAALAYRSWIRKKDEEQRVLVYDLGGGTFDISLLEVIVDGQRDVYQFYTRLVSGDTHLGGDDIDSLVTDWIVKQIKDQYNLNVQIDDSETRAELRMAAEEAKKGLSKDPMHRIRRQGLNLGQPTPIDIDIPMTRVQLEACAEPIIRKAVTITERAVCEIKGLDWSDIDEIFMVGGQTLMPAIQKSIYQLTGKQPRVLDRPQEAVALGAGEYAYTLSLGKEKFEERALINVIALPLGIRLKGDRFLTLIPANRTVPRDSEVHSVETTEDGQKYIDVEVLQGRSHQVATASEAVTLDVLRMDAVPAPKGDAVFDIVFSAQDDGTLKIIVTDRQRNLRKVLDIAQSVTAHKDAAEPEESAAKQGDEEYADH